MPLLEARAPLPRRERDLGKMHPGGTQKTQTLTNSDVKHAKQYMPVCFSSFSACILGILHRELVKATRGVNVNVEAR